MKPDVFASVNFASYAEGYIYLFYRSLCYSPFVSEFFFPLSVVVCSFEDAAFHHK